MVSFDGSLARRFSANFARSLSCERPLKLQRHPDYQWRTQLELRFCLTSYKDWQRRDEKIRNQLPEAEWTFLIFQWENLRWILRAFWSSTNSVLLALTRVQQFMASLNQYSLWKSRHSAAYRTCSAFNKGALNFHLWHPNCVSKLAIKNKEAL